MVFGFSHTTQTTPVWCGMAPTFSGWVECLRHLGFAFEDFVTAGYDLPVVDLQLRYHQPLTLGEAGVVKTRLDLGKGVRLTWRYEIYRLASRQLCVTGQVLLVPVDMAKRKITRRLPAKLQPMFDSLQQYFAVDV